MNTTSMGQRTPTNSTGQSHGLENKRLYSGLIYNVTFMEVDSSNAIAIQARIKYLLWIFQLSTFGEGQSHCIFQRISHTYDSIMGPNRDSLWFRRLFPLHFFDH